MIGGLYSDLGWGYLPVALWDSVTTPAREEAEAAVCAQLRAGWRPPTSDLADDLEVLVTEDWSPKRSVRHGGGAATGRSGVHWDGVRRTGVVPS